MNSPTRIRNPSVTRVACTLSLALVILAGPDAVVRRYSAQRGFRFCTNASIPSAASGDAKSAAIFFSA